MPPRDDTPYHPLVLLGPAEERASTVSLAGICPVFTGHVSGTDHVVRVEGTVCITAILWGQDGQPGLVENGRVLGVEVRQWICKNRGK